MCDIRALNIILARESEPLKKKMASVVRHRERRLELESRLKGRAWSKAEEEGTVHLDLSLENDEVLAKARVFERLNEAFLSKMENVRNGKSLICDWLGDREAHVSDLQAGKAYFDGYFQMYRDPAAPASRIPLDVEICEKMLDDVIGGMKGMVELDTMIRHAFIASMALGAEMPATVREILNGNEKYFRGLKDQLFSDLYTEAIESLRTERQKEEIVDELLKLLYSKDWEKYKDETKGDYPERQRAAEEEELWKARFSKELSFVDFSLKKRREFMRLSERDIEKAIRFAKLADKGIFSHDIFLLMRNNATPSETDAHVAADKFLGLHGLAHEDLLHAVKVVVGKHREQFLLKLKEYAGWLRLMPEGFTDLQKQELSAVLALALKPPERPQEVYALLSDNTLRIVNEMKATGEEKGAVFSLFGNYKSYAQLVSLGKEDAETPQFVPPHKEIYFSEMLNWCIWEREVSSEDVKFALAYGLKLSSEEGMREGRKQIPVEVFRDRLREILPPGEKDARERAHKVEEVLSYAGVISYTRDTTMVGLNINGKGGTREEPTMSKEILRMVRYWVADSMPAEEGGKGYEGSDEEHAQKEMPLRVNPERLANEFGLAESADKKVNFLGALGKLSEEDAAPTFHLGMRDPHEEVRAAALTCMAGFRGKKAAMDAINMLLLDSSLLVQENAAKTLGETGAQRGIGPLIVRLNNGSEGVRAECAKSLGKIMSADAITALEDAAEHDSSESVRTEASEALAKIRSAE
jgi:hypothetical protein